MSKFLDILRARIDSCGIGELESYLPIHLVDDHQSKVDKTIQLIDSLGENARRMLEIGIVQDELVKLGFEHGPKLDYPQIGFMFHDKEGIAINFYTEWLFAHELGRVYYSSSTWQGDILNKVKELIND